MAVMNDDAFICREVRLSKFIRVDGPSLPLIDGAAIARKPGELPLLLMRPLAVPLSMGSQLVLLTFDF
jgi:hypothetical protein